MMKSRSLGGLFASAPEAMVDLAKLEELSIDELERVAGGTPQTVDAGVGCGGICQSFGATTRGVFTIHTDTVGSDCD